ncbi:Zn-ribbon domain-containing OB-fold protein [Novosphingobium resinovorum]|uniref:Zn-ribbon domain-containing OB-fold protein n=1 Tax=Novosphingobium resinovorum TaxID=158500 RepID=UPI002ED2F83B|nr:zinc ribbon domain-containing protein [Novosphingobium resinovorum]
MPLQTCLACGAAQYPSRDVCRVCLSDALEVRETPLEGHVVAEAALHRSLEPDRLHGGPLRIGVVATDLGIRALVALASNVRPGAAVWLTASDGPAGPILAVRKDAIDPAQAGGPGNFHG